MNWLILLGNLIFIYIWGYKGWQEADYNTIAWWFDAYGHMIFGFAWAFILLYWTRRYLRWLYVPMQKWFLALVLVIAVVTLNMWLEQKYQLNVAIAS